MTTELIWSALVHVVKGLKAREDGAATRGQFTIVDDDDLAALNLCLAHNGETGADIQGNPGGQTLTKGMTVALSVAPRLGFGLVVKDMDALLSAPGTRVKAKRRFLLLDSMVSSDETVAEGSEVARYLLVLQLIQGLKECAAFLDQDDQALVFINEGRFDVPVAYGAKELHELRIDDVKALTTLIPTDTHKKQCGAILASAVVDLAKVQKPEERFAHLLANAGDLRKRYDLGYKIYASGFSYEKLKDTVEAARVEYAGKIHKVFSDIQNQVLGIPVATIIVATQMKSPVAPAAGFGQEFFVNTAVLFGCWVFAILTGLLMRNQRHTLDVLSQEIARQKKQLEQEYEAVAGTFQQAFEFLAKRAKTQRRALRTMDIVVAFGLGLSHVVYFYLTPEAWAWVATRFAS